METKKVHRDTIDLTRRVCSRCGQKRPWRAFYRSTDKRHNTASFYAYEFCEPCRRSMEHAARTAARGKQQRLSGQGGLSEGTRRARDQAFKAETCECGSVSFWTGGRPLCACKRSDYVDYEHATMD